ncbi:MAG: mechanosensitive ion channel family protein [Acidobacteriota bacterium]|nr:MAG: mechanosensitive ion channel family protein [Acidobacteriota bacterium]
MMEEILTKTYFGNTVQDWFLALVLILGAVILGRALYWVLKRSLGRLTSRTESRLDDIIVDMIEEPITFILTLVGINYGIKVLTLPEAMQGWVGGAFRFLIILTIAWLLARLFDAVQREYLVPWAAKTETDFDDQLLPIISKSTKVLIWVLGVIIALDNVGYDVGALLAGLGIGGLALAMAAKDTVSNVFGGFTIFADKPFTLNDRVVVRGYDGFVREVGLRSTRLETLEGRIVTIPNSAFSDSPVENISLEPSRKVILKLGLTYDTTPDQMNQAISLLKEIGAANPSLEEKLITGFTGFLDFSLEITFIYYIKAGSDIVGTQSQVNFAILEAFNKHGLEFAFPTQTIYTQNQ